MLSVLHRDCGRYLGTVVVRIYNKNSPTDHVTSNAADMQLA